MHSRAGNSAADAKILIEEVEAAGDDLTRTVAIVWTWLESHPRELGSLYDKYSLIVKSALDSSPFEAVTDKTIEWLADDPLRNAAELLARIDKKVGEASWPEVEFSLGVEEAEVVVAWRVSALVRRLSRDGIPPVAREYPTPAALAPSLLVCPRTANQIDLVVVEPDDDDAWDEALRQMEVGLAHEDESEFSVHLDTLGDHGISAPVIEQKRYVGRFDPAKLDKDDQSRCVKAARSAVQRATGPASILVMPELAATPTVLAAISAELRDTEDAPLLTVVGLYHLIPEDQPEPGPLAKETGWSDYVNEAVILGPDGDEIWRHRKLTCASAEVEEGSSEEEDGNPSEDRIGENWVVEDIRLGEIFAVLPTPMGTVATVICMDAIAPHARERITQSPANVLFVPSLSRTVSRHRTSLQHVAQALPGVAYVCNRWLEKGSWNGENSRSFWAILQRSIVLPKEKGPDEHPSFVFELSKHDLKKRPPGA